MRRKKNNGEGKGGKCFVFLKINNGDGKERKHSCRGKKGIMEAIFFVELEKISREKTSDQ